MFVELPTIDMDVTQGDAIGAVESVKSASDIMSPVSGKVLEANDSLEEKPSIINASPEDKGWIAKIAISKVDEMQELMDADAYKAFTSEEQ